MAQLTDAEKAEELSQRRTRMLPVLAMLFLFQQFTFMNGGLGSGDRAVDHVRIAAWLVMSIVILVVLTTGGGFIYSREARRLANDEATRVHRDRSFRAGFLASMAACIIVYLVSFFEPMAARDAIHWVMTVGIAVTLLWFAFLERRASRNA
jgi:heme/copper-type cytochrome/quinol oxidase subunit 2